MLARARMCAFLCVYLCLCVSEKPTVKISPDVTTNNPDSVTDQVFVALTCISSFDADDITCRWFLNSVLIPGQNLVVFSFTTSVDDIGRNRFACQVVRKDNGAESKKSSNVVLIGECGHLYNLTFI